MRKLARLLRYDWPLHLVLVLTNWLPDNVCFLRLRGLLASPFFGTCGHDLRLGRSVTFYNPSNVHLGSHIYIALGCWLMAGDIISINDEVLLGPYCVIVSSNHTRSSGSFRYGSAHQAPISIGKGSWLAAHVVVTAGANIGRGTLIAANSVVTNDIRDDVFAAGQPAWEKKKILDEQR